MKKIQLLFVFVIIGIIGYGQSKEIAPAGGSRNVTLIPGNQKSLKGSISTVVWDNGPLVNSIGTGASGADESVLQDNSLGLETLGFGFQTSSGFWLVDDFVLTSAQQISQILVYGYQTGSTTTSTMTDVYLQIYSGQPGAGGTLVWGDNVTDRMVSSVWSGIYRVTETSSGATNRPIMECTCDVNKTLPAGNYWLAVQMNGTLGSGPWCPPVTITGQTTTGNSIQYTGTWDSAVDGSFQQAMPFVIMGSPVVPFNIYYILAVFALIGVGIVVKKRLF
jgi:hypothetical protein